ncbi:hypothetical protein [Sphingopyxis sp. Root1497]|uniref:hypothetical protein n=1 Tax=Sphingopyxis sp. Root1497 TaxID=1736474 RepID=UPI000A86C877|nr:hypothetical protein [Sphingopyxis sp. Root1497]
MVKRDKRVAKALEREGFRQDGPILPRAPKGRREATCRHEERDIRVGESSRDRIAAVPISKMDVHDRGIDPAFRNSPQGWSHTINDRNRLPSHHKKIFFEKHSDDRVILYDQYALQYRHVVSRKIRRTASPRKL